MDKNQIVTKNRYSSSDINLENNNNKNFVSTRRNYERRSLFSAFFYVQHQTQTVLIE